MSPIQRYSPLTLRSARRFCLLLVTGVLWVGPLSAQGNTVITVNDTTVVTIYDNDSTFIFIEFPEPDSAAIARAEAGERASQSIADYFENCGCQSGTPVVIQATNVALVFAAFFIGWQLKGIKERPADIDTHGDVNVTVSEHKHPNEEESEGH